MYYPIATLPGWLQPLAFALPASHVFEGMRGIMLEGVVKWHLLGTAAALNAVYLTTAVAVFLYTFRYARRHGLLLNVGE